MGAWGPGLYQDDVAEDVKTEYLKLLKSGKINQDATEQLIKDNQIIINDSDDAPAFWFALADTQWKLGRLLPYVKEKALEYLKNGDNLKMWEQQSKKEGNYRKKVLLDLESRLISNMPSERKISQFKYFKCSWKIGDTFAYRFESEYAKEHGFYGRYIIIYKIDEFIWKKGEDADVLPIVYLKITNTKDLPTNLEEINNCTFLISSPFDKRYRYINNSKSKKFFKKIIFIGNFNEINLPKDEKILKNVPDFIHFDLNDIEERIIKYEIK